MVSGAGTPDVCGFTPGIWNSTIDAIRKLGDVYEKRRRIEQLMGACEDANASQMAPEAWAALQTGYARLGELIATLPTSVLEDRDALRGPDGEHDACGREVVGETLDELFDGLNLAATREDEPAGPMGMTQPTRAKVVELKPGRQYRKVMRKNGAGQGTVVHVKDGGLGRLPDTLDATSVGEKEDVELDVPSEDVDAAQLEAARYGDGTIRHESGKPNALEIPVSEEVLVRALAGAADGHRETCSSSGGSTRAMVGRNRGDWYGRVDADERRVGQAGSRGESSGSESGESLTSPAVESAKNFL